MAAAGDTQAGTVLVAPYAGSDREKLPVVLDIVNGGAVAVTAWQAVDRMSGPGPGGPGGPCRAARGGIGATESPGRPRC